MRRKDRAMGREFSLEVIDKAEFGTMSMVGANGKPYAVPLSIVRDGEILFFHSATTGKKVEILAEYAEVCITFVGKVQVPDVMSQTELEEIRQDKSKAGRLGSKVFTTEFESAMVIGRVELVESDKEKIQALKLLCLKYTPDKMEYFNLAAASSISKTNIYRMHINELTGKRKKFDQHGDEMKWERME